jgi:hypothetical protein
MRFMVGSCIGLLRMRCGRPLIALHSAIQGNEKEAAARITEGRKNKKPALDSAGRQLYSILNVPMIPPDLR